MPERETVLPRFEKCAAYYSKSMTLCLVLKVLDRIPEDFSGYDFVCINTISEGKVSPDKIRRLIRENRGISFILIYHTRKDGEFRGTQEHAHLVDVLVEVNGGWAVAKGRFGKGEMYFWRG